MSNGCVIWLTGVSGSGKSTIANLLRLKLEPKVNDLHLLDGDEIRDLMFKNITPKKLVDTDDKDSKESSALGSLGLKPKPAL